MKHLRLLIFLVIASAIGAMVGASSHTPDRATRIKSRHYLYEGMRYETMGNSAAAHELYRRAYQLNPANLEASAQYGMSRLLIDLDTLQSPDELNKSLSMMSAFVDRYPDDYFEGEHYAYIAQLLDTVQETIRVLERIDSLYPERTANLVTLMQAYTGIQDLEKAIAMIDSFENREGTNLRLSGMRIALMLGNNDTIGAIRNVNRMISEDTTSSQYVILKGELFDYINRPDSALYYYLEAQRIEPTSYTPLMALVEAYRARGDSVNLDKTTYNLLMHDDLDIEEKTDLMGSYLQMLVTKKQDTARGDSLFAVLTAQYPHEAQVLDLAARYNAAKGKPKLAIENIKYALDQDGTNRNYWAQLMSYYLQDRQPSEALKTYDEAIKHIDPDNGLITLRAASATLNKDYPLTARIYTDMIEEMVPGINVDDSIVLNRLYNLSYEDLLNLSEAFTSLGDAYFQNNDTVKAFRAYDNALEINPANPLTLNNYAYFLALSGTDLQRAEEMSASALLIDDGNPTYLDTYAWILFLRRDYIHALEYQQAAIEKAEANRMESPDLYSHYADILFMNGKPDEAVKFWRKALDINNNDLSEKELKLLRKKIEHRAFFYD